MLKKTLNNGRFFSLQRNQNFRENHCFRRRKMNKTDENVQFLADSISVIKA